MRSSRGSCGTRPCDALAGHRHRCYPDLCKCPRNPVAKLNIAVKRFTEKPGLWLIHAVGVTETGYRNVGRDRLLVVAVRRSIGRLKGLIRIWIREAWIRCFKLFGQPGFQSDAANTGVESGIGPEGCLFKKSHTVAGPAVANEFRSCQISSTGTRNFRTSRPQRSRKGPGDLAHTAAGTAVAESDEVAGQPAPKLPRWQGRRRRQVPARSRSRPMSLTVQSKDALDLRVRFER